MKPSQWLMKPDRAVASFETILCRQKLLLKSQSFEFVSALEVHLHVYGGKDVLSLLTSFHGFAPALSQLQVIGEPDFKCFYVTLSVFTHFLICSNHGDERLLRLPAEGGDKEQGVHRDP